MGEPIDVWLPSAVALAVWFVRSPELQDNALDALAPAIRAAASFKRGSARLEPREAQAHRDAFGRLVKLLEELARDEKRAAKLWPVFALAHFGAHLMDAASSRRRAANECGFPFFSALLARVVRPYLAAALLERVVEAAVKSREREPLGAVELAPFSEALVEATEGQALGLYLSARATQGDHAITLERSIEWTRDLVAAQLMLGCVEGARDTALGFLGGFGVNVAQTMAHKSLGVQARQVLARCADREWLAYVNRLSQALSPGKFVLARQASLMRPEPVEGVRIDELLAQADPVAWLQCQLAGAEGAAAVVAQKGFCCSLPRWLAFGAHPPAPEPAHLASELVFAWTNVLQRGSSRAQSFESAFAELNASRRPGDALRLLPKFPASF